MNTILTKIVKTVVTVALIGATLIGYSSMAPMWAYIIPSVHTLNHCADAEAPDVEIDISETLFGTNETVEQYDIKPGKYYILKGLCKGKTSSFGYDLVKVVRAYTKKTWHGSERVLEVKYCNSGKIGYVHPSKGVIPTHFYDAQCYNIEDLAA